MVMTSQMSGLMALLERAAITTALVVGFYKLASRLVRAQGLQRTARVT